MNKNIVAILTASVVASSVGALAFTGAAAAQDSIATPNQNITVSTSTSTPMQPKQASRAWYFLNDNSTVQIGEVDYSITGGAISGGHGYMNVQPIGNAPNMRITISNAHVKGSFLTGRYVFTWPNGSGFAPLASRPGSPGIPGNQGFYTGPLFLNDGQQALFGSVVVRPAP